MSSQHKPLRTSRATVRATLSNIQLRQLLQIAGEDPGLQDLYNIATIISHTGLRRSEVEGLLWSNVDLAGSRLEVCSPKASSGRNVPLDATSRQILEALRARDPEAVFVLGQSPQQVLHRVRLQLRAVARKMGVGPISFHSLRRFFLMRLWEAGADVATVMAIAGWTSSSFKMLFKVSSLTTRQAYERAMRDSARIEGEI
jgi:integrase